MTLVAIVFIHRRRCRIVAFIAWRRMRVMIHRLRIIVNDGAESGNYAHGHVIGIMVHVMRI